MKFGLAAWSNRHFDHILYPLRTPHKEWLPRYSRVFPIVEADILHHQRMPEADLHAWVEQTPDGFRFLPKMHKDATHGAHDDAALAAALAADEALAPLRDAGRVGPTLAQFPRSFRLTPDNLEWLERFMAQAPAEGLAVELRHGEWFTEDIRGLLDRAGVALCWSTYDSAIAPHWPAPSTYIRFVGTVRKKRDRWVTQKDRLEDILAIRADAPDDAYVIVTNRFEGHAIDSLPRIAAALGDTDLADRCTRPPAQALLPD